MAKIGRNAPCPCGSGKKYKKCCLGKKVFSDSPVPTPSAKAVKPKSGKGARSWHWSTDEIRMFDTAEIISKLRGFGVDFKEAQFIKDTDSYVSACELAKHWEEIHPVNAAGFDVDFIWMACIVLWERLRPDRSSIEAIDDLMQDGYAALKSSPTSVACDIWLEVWEKLKPYFAKRMTSVDEADDQMDMRQFVSNWCQDLEMELFNAALHDVEYHRKRVEYCREFCSFFPDSDRWTLENMKTAAAESLMGMGRIEEGEQAFQNLIDEFPESAWPYIKWGDVYTGTLRKNFRLNLDKAKEIYEMALEKHPREKRAILERLEDLKRP